jgi:hypothetical protein
MNGRLETDTYEAREYKAAVEREYIHTAKRL